MWSQDCLPMMGLTVILHPNAYDQLLYQDSQPSCCLLFICRVRCVTCCGVTQMTGVAGGFLLEVLGTPLAKIYQKHLITLMALLLLQELINLSWRLDFVL